MCGIRVKKVWQGYRGYGGGCYRSCLRKEERLPQTVGEEKDNPTLKWNYIGVDMH